MGWGPCWLASLQLASLQLWWLIGIGLDMGRWIACGHYLWLPSLHQYSSFSFSFWHLCAIMPLNRTLRSWLYYGNQFWTHFLGLLTKTCRLSCLSDSCLEVVLQGKFDSLLTESQNSLNTERLYLTWFFYLFLSRARLFPVSIWFDGPNCVWLHGAVLKGTVAHTPGCRLPLWSSSPFVSIMLMKALSVSAAHPLGAPFNEFNIWSL